jgi:hypothetical protein
VQSVGCPSIADADERSGRLEWTADAG